MKKTIIVITLCFIVLVNSCQTGNKAADKGSEFDKGSKITVVNLSASKIEDLVILGKVWGFLKYYHPAVAKGDCNWDGELIRILPKVIDAKNYEERNKIIARWIDQLGKVRKALTSKTDSATLKLSPDLAWITDNSNLGEKLTGQLIQIRDAKRDSNYYVSLVPNVGNPQFNHEDPYSQMKFPDTGYRLLSLYRYWNIIQYFFPNRHLIDEDWNLVLNEFVPKFINASNETEYKLAVLEIVARIHDTHANFWSQDEAIRIYQGMYYAPIEITFIENKAVVTGYYGQNFVKETGLKIGDIITRIDNLTVEDVVKARLKYTPASNYPTQLRDIATNLLRTNNSVIKIEYVRNGVSKLREIKTYRTNLLNFPHRSQLDINCFKFINSNVAYLYLGSIKGKLLPEIWINFKGTKGLIIDLRCYPSEFMVFNLGTHLMTDCTAFVKFSIGSIIHPGLFTITPVLKVGKKNNDYYKGKVVILINETTQSQAEYTTMAFRVAPDAKVIGSTTAGADGNISFFYLPGDIRTAISGIGVYYPDGRETQRIGIVPDIEIKPTIKGLKENRDELIEKAIEIISKN